MADRRSVVFTVKLTPEEARAIRDAAKLLTLSPSAFVREAIADGIGRSLADRAEGPPAPTGPAAVPEGGAAAGGAPP